MMDLKIIVKTFLIIIGLSALQEIKAQVTLSLPLDSVVVGEGFLIPVSLEGLQNSGDEICGFTLAIKYDNSIIQITGFDIENTYSSGFSIEQDSLYTDSLYTISGASATCINSDGTLINLIANSLTVNKAELVFQGIEINEGNPTVSSSNGVINVIGIVSSEVDLASQRNFTLHQNYPNPFNPSTNIEFSLPIASEVELKVFDLTGREIATLVSGKKSAGDHLVNFEASQLSSGVYIYRIETRNFVETRKMLLIK